MSAPQRKHEIAIRIGADSWEELLTRLRNLEDYLHIEGPGRELVSGGPASGCIAVDNECPSQTHEVYFEQVEKWIEKRRREKALLQEPQET